MNNLTILLASSAICFLSSSSFAHRIAPVIDGDDRDREPQPVAFHAGSEAAEPMLAA